MGNNQEVITEEKAQEHRLRYLQKYMGLTEEEGRDLVNILTQPTPEDVIESRPARGGSMVQYVAGPHFITRFNEAFGFLWSYEVPHSFELDGQIVAKGRWSLQIPGRTITRKNQDGTEETIRFDGFQIVKEQFGSSEIKKYSKDQALKDKKGIQIRDKNGKPLWSHRAGDVIDLGDDYKGAGTDAMKKCGTLLGIFLDVYSRRSSEEEGGISKQQYEVFYMRAEEAGIGKEQAEKWASERLEKPFKDIDSLEIMGLIPALMDLKEEVG